MKKVEVVHWNPRINHRRGGVRRFAPIGRRVNNFGDLLGPLIVNRLLTRAGFENSRASVSGRLLTVGSIMSLARNGDTVWGTGINGKSLDRPLRASVLDIRAVRGPLTHEVLVGRGYKVPQIFGDPGLLVGQLWGREELRREVPRRQYTVVNNLNDWSASPVQPAESLDPTSPLDLCLATIAASDYVIGSSLHGIIVAESLGIPARLITSESEPAFKYSDYYLGTGRNSYVPAKNVEDALAMGGEPQPDWDSSRLLEAFPYDLWA